jgi:hypothetical protein
MPKVTSEDRRNMKEIASELEKENPLWIVVFGDYTGQFVAFPRFRVPVGTMAVAYYPFALADRMRAVERATSASTESSETGRAPCYA